MATGTMNKEFIVETVTLPSEEYTANVEKNLAINLTQHCKSGYKAVGVLGFNTNIQRSTIRRCFVDALNNLQYSATSPVNTTSDFTITLLEQKI